MHNPEFTLTRYLYIREDVLTSLIISIFEKNYDTALFWASELYYSNNKKETIDFIYSIYRNFYYSNNPKLDKLMLTGLERYDKGIHIAATMILNLVSKPRLYTLQHFIGNELDPDAFEGAKEKESNLWIFPYEIESQKYSTENLEKDKPSLYKLLRQVCKYKSNKDWLQVFGCVYKDMDSKELLIKHRDNWLYYASFTPLWEERINQYNGIIDYDKKEVKFEDDDDFENFYELYGYDVDEQPFEVFDKISHTSILSKNNVNAFYKKYEPNMKIIKVKKLKRVNKVCGQSK
jgi:hypothetical protein